MGVVRLCLSRIEEAAELRGKGVRFSIYRPDEDEFRLRVPLQLQWIGH